MENDLKAAIDTLFKEITGRGADEIKKIMSAVHDATPPISEKNAGSVVMEAVGWHHMTMMIAAAESIMRATQNEVGDAAVEDACASVEKYIDELAAFAKRRLAAAKQRVLEDGHR